MDGFPVVLTADGSLMAGYRLLFDGMLLASQTTTTPGFLLDLLLMPRAPSNGLRAVAAPLGLRRIEAALRQEEFSEAEVAVVPEDQLRKAIGPRTRVVAVSAGEPLGLGMNSTTMTAVVGGRIYPEQRFRRMMSHIRRLIARRAPEGRLMLGGPGAWQVAGNADIRRELGIDHVVTGYAEGNIARVMRQLLNGETLPEVIAGQGTPVDRVPRILGPSTMGVVEISRGCGLGCRFCALAREPMDHIPPEVILADVRSNLAHGVVNISTLSEDAFRYGSHGRKIEPGALTDLLSQVRNESSVRLIQLDHANIASLTAFTDQQLGEVRALLVGDTGVEYPWVNLGVETASGRLMATCGRGKMGEISPEEWGAVCEEQIHRLCRAGFFPMVSLVIGLPEETADDIHQTQALIDRLADQRISIFPVLYAPMNGEPPPDASRLTTAHWQLIRSSYRLNFRWIPHMYWDNQRGAGVSLGRRCLMQLLGRGQVIQWQALLAWHEGRAPRE